MDKLVNIKILLIDDDKHIRSMLKEKLVLEGGLVAEASTASDAFSKIKKHHFDVVVSDLRALNTSGAEFMQLVRDCEEKAPRVILMSAFSDITLSEAHKMGAQGLFLKPQNVRNLIELITED